ALARAYGLACGALVLFLSCASVARGQETPAARPPQPTAPARQSEPAAVPQQPQPTFKFAPFPAPGQATPFFWQNPAPVTPATPVIRSQRPTRPRAPQRVVTVIHRLSGWKLLNRLAAGGQSVVSVDDLPGASDVHTNIVAGFVSEDGRTVMARLPQAEAEVETTPGAPFGLFGNTEEVEPATPDITLVRGDGKSFKAKFVGLDASTGLSLLEAFEPILPPQAELKFNLEVTPATVGQLVRLYAPAPVAPRAVPPSPNVRGAPDGDEGVIYFGMGTGEGYLTEVKRAASGKTFQMLASTAYHSPAWTGAVVTNDAGALVGIVAESNAAQTRIVPFEVVRGAAERVLARGASVPQPWLGVRGGSVAGRPLDWFVSNGWDKQRALPLLQEGHGVLLTSVLPNTPAALGGLRPGDVITNVGGKAVSGVEDFGQLLREAGVGSNVNFKVLRPFEPTPVEILVRLSETQNAVRATGEAELRQAEQALSAERAKFNEARAAVDELRAKMAAMAREAREAREARARARALRTEAESGEYTERLAVVEQRLREVETREANLQNAYREAVRRSARVEAQVLEAEMRLSEAFGRVAPTRGAAPQPGRVRLPTKPLLGHGLETIGLTQRSAAQVGARNGLLVVAVRPESPAAAAGLRPGDVVEAINGQLLDAPNWGAHLHLPSASDLALSVVRERKRITLKLPRPIVPPTPRAVQ
ncbi:MAG TPA: PDZ domain-containing protein, partial [Pyrinomonadaceae bacterium]|nr:PDZ domain-containing protein [Pyrinomonadaceae bacterium]